MSYHRSTTSEKQETEQQYREAICHDYAGTAFVSLGSNLSSRFGNPLQTVLQGIEALKRHSTRSPVVSSLWRTDPVDCPPGSMPFVNGIAVLSPHENETAVSMLRALQHIENDYGRRRSGVINEPRSLDLDLISFRNLSLNTDDLVLPHPRSHERRFVLLPLAELAPDLVLPGQALTVEELLQKVEDQGQLQRLGRPEPRGEWAAD